MWCLGFTFKTFTSSVHLFTFSSRFTLYPIGYGGGGGGGGMVVFTYSPALYNDYGMTVDVGNGVEGMGDALGSRTGQPGSDGQEIMNSVQVV